MKDIKLISIILLVIGGLYLNYQFWHLFLGEEFRTHSSWFIVNIIMSAMLTLIVLFFSFILWLIYLFIRECVLKD